MSCHCIFVFGPSVSGLPTTGCVLPLLVEQLEGGHHMPAVGETWLTEWGPAHSATPFHTPGASLHTPHTGPPSVAFPVSPVPIHPLPVRMPAVVQTRCQKDHGQPDWYFLGQSEDLPFYKGGESSRTRSGSQGGTLQVTFWPTAPPQPYQPLPPQAVVSVGSGSAFRALPPATAYPGCSSEPVLWKTKQKK